MLTVFAGGISVLSVFLSLVFMELMGMINGLQIQALSCLFRVRLPINALMIMTMILKFAAFDMFQTENINEKIFKFTKTDSFSQIFDDAGY